MNNLEEIWKIIENFPDYMVSNQGRVKSFKRYEEGKILTPQKNSHGYLYVVLYKNGKPKHKYIHHLIYEIFNDYKLKKDECVHHKDENLENNYIDNLKKMTLSGHSILHNTGKNNPNYGKKQPEHSKRMKGKNNPNYGKHPSEENKRKQSERMKGKYKGENNSNSILTEKDVIEIWRYLNEGILTQKEIAKMFGVKPNTISQIKTGRSWKHIRENK